MPRRKRRSEAALLGFFALGPIPLSVAAAAGRAGPWCMSVLLAVRAGFDMSNGCSVTVKWIAAALDDTNIRTVRRAVSSLVDAGMVVRHGDEITIPSWSRLQRHVSGKG